KRNLWADVPGQFDYQELSDLAQKNGVRKDAKYLNGKIERNEPADQGGGVVGGLMGSIMISIIAMVVINYFINRRLIKNPMNGQTKVEQIELSRLDLLEEKVTFDDVAGIDDEMEKIKSLVFDIKHPELLETLGGRLPTGCLLVGPPGTGKTYIVRAMATEIARKEEPARKERAVEAESTTTVKAQTVPVLACSGGDFVDKYVGVGASRVREAFAKARELRDQHKTWVILFIDELDAVAQVRSSGFGAHEERNQTVGQLLVELQGSENDNSRILIIGASNRPEVIDPAVMRAGRLGDLKIEVSAPDKAGRAAILRVKLKKVPAADDVDAESLAAETSGLVGADLDTLVVKKAPAFAKKRLIASLPPGMPVSLDSFKPEQLKVTHDDLFKAYEEMVMGSITELKGRRLAADIKRMIAYHELGHFTVAYRKYLQNTGSWDGQYGDAIAAVSILGPSGIGGFVRTVPEHSFKTAKNLKSTLAIALAGNRAEKLFLGDVTVGAANDLENATRTIKAMLLQLNMSHCNNKGWRLPAISAETAGQTKYLGGQASYSMSYGMSDFSAKQVDDMIALFLDEAEAEAEVYLLEEREFIEYMVPILVEAERMRLTEIKAHWEKIHGGRDLSRAVAFPYLWDENHRGMKERLLPHAQRPDAQH
ncbi:MAG TPA: ATP-dependent metallopeptidase FtsH/Yme1/Tma family protein, partial [Candidatus Obscuribacterales bacterium]